uniref:Uncharacterized protein n=1 Tax=Arundo donax TaxID=35708 RepID=A0A0A9ASW3_ARUDO
MPHITNLPLPSLREHV